MFQPARSVVSILLCCLTIPSCRRAAPPPGVEQIDGAVLKAHVYALADDSMQGRAPATAGFTRAMQYAEGAMGSAGLLPFFDEEPFYRQPVPLVRVDLERAATLTLRDEQSETTMMAGDGFDVLYPGREGARTPAGPPAFVGFGIHAPELGWDDFRGLDLRGRIAMYMPGLPDSHQDPDMPDALRALFPDRFEADQHTLTELLRRGAAGVLVIPDAAMVAAWDSVLSSRPSLLPAESDAVDALANPPVPVLLAHPSLADRLVTEYGYDPFARQGAYRPTVLEDVELALEMQVRRRPAGSANIVGLVLGSDPELMYEYVVLGAHLDHLGVRSGAVYNGANDDASGSAAVLEIARALALDPPARSVIIALFTAEEVGRYGSFQFLARPVAEQYRMVADVQLERLGRVADGETCAVHASPQFEDVVDRAADMTPGAHIGFVATEEGYAARTDDHSSFHLRGVPWLVLDCGWFSDQHQPTDDADRLDYALLERNTRMAYALVRLLAGG